MRTDLRLLRFRQRSDISALSSVWSSPCPQSSLYSRWIVVFLLFGSGQTFTPLLSVRAADDPDERSLTWRQHWALNKRTRGPITQVLPY
jgi:hypothetical protein